MGDLSASGSVKLDGIIEGNIYCASITIMPNGRVNGGIVATREVIVHGKVTGAIRSRLVMLQSSAKVEGDISYQLISIEMGASHDGMLCRTEDEHPDEASSPINEKQEEHPEEMHECQYSARSSSSGLNRRFSMHNDHQNRFCKDDLRHESQVYLPAE